MVIENLNLTHQGGNITPEIIKEAISLDYTRPQKTGQESPKKTTYPPIPKI